MKRWHHMAIQMTLANIIAISIAYTLSLSNPITAGILAVLSIQLTKTDTVYIALKRLLDAVIAILLGTLFFYFFGYTTLIFILFTPIFIAVSHSLKIEAGIVPSLVLASQLLIHGTFSFSVILNSFTLIFIAILVALTIQAFYPTKSSKILASYTNQFDNAIQTFIELIVSNLRKKDDSDATYQNLFMTLKRLLKKAETIDKDIIFSKDKRPIAYIKMRYAQTQHLKRMYKLSSAIQAPHEHQFMIADYLEALISDIGEQDKATPQKEKLTKLLETYRTKPLPKNRQDFETRAILYQMIFEIESFLNEKIQYHQTY